MAMYLFENIKLTESIRFLLNMKQNAVFQKHVVFFWQEKAMPVVQI